MEFFYSDAADTSGGVEDFVQRFAAGNGFALENFEIKHGYAKAKCDGFSIRANKKLNSHITITDDQAAAKAKDQSGSITDLLDTE